MTSSRAAMASVTIGFVTLSVVAPVVALVTSLAGPSNSLTPWYSVTSVMVGTVRLAFLSSFFAIALGTLVALGSRRWSAGALVLLLLAVAASAAFQTTLRSAYLQRFLGLIAPPGVSLAFGEPAIVLGLVLYLVPFTLPPLVLAVQRIDPEAELAAKLCGASARIAVWHCYLRPVAPAAAAVFVLAFVLAIGAYVTPAVLGGVDSITASRYLASLLNEGRGTEAAVVGLAAAATPALAFAIALIAARVFHEMKERD